jgi:hypothetical protein
MNVVRDEIEPAWKAETEENKTTLLSQDDVLYFVEVLQLRNLKSRRVLLPSSRRGCSARLVACRVKVEHMPTSTNRTLGKLNLASGTKSVRAVL